MNDTYILLKDLPNINKGAKLVKAYTNYVCADKFGSLAYLNIKLVENNPEWFRKEESKKEYEILSFCDHKKTGEFYAKNQDGTFSNSFFRTRYSANHLIEKNFSINSVERLSDNRVFTIGDKTNKGEILKFDVLKDGRLWILTSQFECFGGIDKFEHQKQPQPKKLLFTTVDGVNIFEGMEYVKVHDDFSTTIYYGNNGANNKLIQEQKNTFSTKEKAEEYILLNKSCLSVNDLLEIEIHRFCFENGFVVTKEKLIELAKQKINKQ